MNLKVKTISNIGGEVKAPPSKSYSHRAPPAYITTTSTLAGFPPIAFMPCGWPESK